VARVADVSVRPARPEDAERVARVQLSTWRTAYADLLPAEALDVPEEQVAALWLNAIEAPPTPRHRVLVAMERIELVGFAASTPADDEGLDTATTTELSTLLVEPRWGRRGHGSRLLAASVEHWRGDGAELAVTWAWERDPATRSFLAGAGWEPDGAGRGLDTGPRVQQQRRFHTDLRSS
jgi:GNAT superfamily N-acetyltransferase